MRTVILLFFVLLSTISKSQLVSLTAQEVKGVKTRISNDSKSATVFNEWKTIADQSLREQPNPIDTIASEGRLISDPKKQLTIKSFADINKIYALAIAYTITDKKIYLKKCTEFLTSWARVNQPMGNPVNDTKLDLVIEAYDLIKKDVGAADQQKIAGWFKKVADEEIKSLRGNYNNWNSHRLKIVTEIAYTLNQAIYIDFVKKNMPLHIANNLYPDGSSLDFKHRDALHYHVYTLEPLLKAAMIIKRANGENYFTYISENGSSIKKSVDFLAVYAKGEKKHAEFVKSTVKIDRDRAAQNEPGFAIGSYFVVAKALDVFAYATYFDSAYAPVYQLLAAGEPITELGPIIIDARPYSKWIPILNHVK